LKILHGGFRYLQNADFRRMRQSFRERALMMQLAPHLTRELPVMVPTSPKLMESRAALRVALRVSEAVGMGLGPAAGSGRGLQSGRILSRAECLRAHPWLDREGLTGAALWYDGQALNPERLTLSFLLSASEAGAELANYAEVVRLRKENSRISGARVPSRLKAPIG
jgi:glycerol-3-phosphate dehydrogenase